MPLEIGTITSSHHNHHFPYALPLTQPKFERPASSFCRGWSSSQSSTTSYLVEQTHPLFVETSRAVQNSEIQLKFRKPAVSTIVFSPAFDPSDQVIKDHSCALLPASKFAVSLASRLLLSISRTKARHWFFRHVLSPVDHTFEVATYHCSYPPSFLPFSLTIYLHTHCFKLA
ncbi:uncharacterized protein CLUP02_03606 [Colletotrichum lupini]|uniref:Uncharacterized protein n=1 Tax=Colletotrichum lupini TaxID=145971 RepID=A0A9Q8SIR9_9PEZI|nr:uncharacterized protein CLUP02_03606 [Colletotrichum lupini]UQC78132.1 hypothetical protein CLUP02_03606 [Colletotrichum lupini]